MALTLKNRTVVIVVANDAPPATFWLWLGEPRRAMDLSIAQERAETNFQGAGAWKTLAPAEP